MSALPRLALGTVQPEADINCLVWGALDFFSAQDITVQHFLSRACFCSRKRNSGAQGIGSRHLDSWLMDRDRCRTTFWHGMAESDLAIIEGRFPAGYTAAERDLQAARSADCGGCRPTAWGGRLDALCEWLDLPRVAVVDVVLADRCRTALRRDEYDAVLLDRVRDEREFITWKTNIESLYALPVVGAMPEAAALRAMLRRETCGDSPSPELCGELGREFARWTDRERLLALACRREFAWSESSAPDFHVDRGPIRIAMAYDEAFNCYFPDAIDAFEAMGAKVVDFSPLKDERLPDGVDVVYLGCGHPELHAERLSANHCMNQSICRYVCGGGRLYAEGGACAYLCQTLETTDGRQHPMVGVFSALARRSGRPCPPRPVEVTMTRRSWLGPAGTVLRGYRNEQWDFIPLTASPALLGELGHEYDMLSTYQAVGSRLHLNFAALPQFLNRFLDPAHVSAASSPAGRQH